MIIEKQRNNYLLERLRELDYLWVKAPIRQWFFGEIVGWNVCASSLLRKKYTIERLEDEIVNQSLPLIVVDENDMSNCFKVFIND